MSLLSAIFRYNDGDVLIQLREYAAALGLDINSDPVDLVQTAFAASNNVCPEDPNDRRDWEASQKVAMRIQGYRSEIFIGLMNRYFVATGIREDGVTMLIPSAFWKEVEFVDILQNSVSFAGGQTFRDLKIKTNVVSRTGGRTGEPGRPSELTLPFVAEFQELEAAEGSLPVNTATARRLIMLVRSKGYSGRIPTERGIVKAILKIKALESES